MSILDFLTDGWKKDLSTKEEFEKELEEERIMDTIEDEDQFN